MPSAAMSDSVYGTGGSGSPAAMRVSTAPGDTRWPSSLLDRPTSRLSNWITNSPCDTSWST